MICKKKQHAVRDVAVCEQGVALYLPLMQTQITPTLSDTGGDITLPLNYIPRSHEGRVWVYHLTVTSCLNLTQDSHFARAFTFSH